MTTPAPSPSPSPGPAVGGGTINPSDAAIAAAGGFTGTGTTSKNNTAAYEGAVIGIDPKTGKPIKSTIQFPAGSEQTFIKGLPPKDRAALQAKLLKLKLYPQGYNPPAGGTYFGKEDFDAIKKLQVIGTQLGKGDINDIITLAEKDSKVASLLATGGYKQTPSYTVTDTLEASATLTDSFLNLFNEKPTKAEIKEYQNLVNARERSSKGAMSAQERQDILYSVANKRLASLTKGAVTGDVAAAEALTEGQLGKRIRDIRAAYEDNGMSVSDKQLFTLAGKSLRSAEAYDNIIEDIKQNVGLQWGQLGQNLKPGQTVRSRLQPYINIASSLMGIPEDEIKTTDLQDVVNTDGSFKRPQEYKALKYKSKEYLGSDQFKQTVFDDTTAVLRNFGVM